ncbi:MAG: hypothetical protein U0324_04190 [Polyangiales bacterium]
MSGDVDPAALARRALRPDRPGLALARAVVVGVSDPREAWERLAARGCVPLAWAADVAGRGFVTACGQCERHGWYYGFSGYGSVTEGCEACEGYGWVTGDGPPSVDACLALAGDPVGVATAEALAREAVARVATWGTLQAPLFESWLSPPRSSSPRRFAWWIEAPGFEPGEREEGPRWAFEPAYAKGPRRWALSDVDEYYLPLPPRLVEALDGHDDLQDEGADIGLGDDADLTRAPGLRLVLRHHARWRLGVARGYGDLLGGPDPFAPLLALASTGYWITAITGAAAVLVAPTVDGPAAK